MGSPAIINAVVVACLYAIVTGALILTNFILFPQQYEFPWTWYWILWAIMFSPAALTTIFASVVTVPNSRRLRVLNMTSLLIIIVAMQVCFALDTSLTAIVATSILVSIVIFSSFKVSG